MPLASLSGAEITTVVAHINADRHLDLVWQGFDGSVTVHRGDGTGRFTERLDYAAGLPTFFTTAQDFGAAVSSLALADVDSDGSLDVLTGHHFGRVSVLRGRGDGTFHGPLIRYGQADGLKSGASAYIDRDGYLDVVTVSDPSTGPSTLAISFGDGAGGFRGRTEFANNESLTSLVLGDVDGDGDVDIVTNGDFKTIQVFLNSGGGGFTLDAVYREPGTSHTITDMQLTDADRDDILDVLASTTSTASGAGTLLFLRGVGGGRFGTFVETPVNRALASAVGDLNGDAVPDLVLAEPSDSSFFSGTISVWSGTGDGRVGSPRNYSINTSLGSVALGNVDRDGDLDMFIVGTTPFQAETAVTVVLNKGLGILGESRQFTVRGPVGGSFNPTSHSITLSDLNGDSNLDVVVTYDGTAHYAGGDDGIFVFFGDGHANLTNRGDYSIGFPDPRAVTIGDLNQDRAPDLIVTSDTNPQLQNDSVVDAITIALNDGYGDFGRFGTADQFAHTSGNLYTVGTLVDGYNGIDRAFEYAFRPGAEKLFVLVTAHDRQVVDSTHGFASIRQALEANGILLDVVVDARFSDGTQASALGVDAQGNALVTDPAGNVSTQPGGQFVSGVGKVDFVDLAWSLGGTAWDLDKLVTGGSPIAQAFADQIAGKLEDRMAITVVTSDPSVSVENLSGPITGVGAGDTATLDVRITGDGQPHAFDLLFVRDGTGNVLGSIPVLINAPEYAYRVRAIDPDGDTLSYQLLQGPAGATLDAQTGELRWRPASANRYSFRVQVSDGRGGLSVQDFEVEVRQGVPNQPPVFDSALPAGATVGLPYAATVAASDPDGDAISYFLTEELTSFSIDKQTGAVSWTPAANQLATSRSA
jgi:hypothetical protein